MADFNLLAAELEIRNLLSLIAQRADTGDIDTYMDCYTKDAIWSMPPNPALGLPATTLQGQDLIREGVVDRRANGIQGPGTNSMHLVTSTSVQVDADSATAQSCWMFISDTTGAKETQSVGRYHDRFVATDTGWRLAERTIIMG